MTHRITAIGEILYDVYPDQKRLGGAPFNFIYHINKIIGHSNFISSVGKDENGSQIINYLDKIGFNTKFINIDKLHPTGTVGVQIDKNGIPKFTISEECCYDYLSLDEEGERLINSETDILYFGTLSQRSNQSRKTIQSLYGRNIKYFCDLNLRHNFFSKEIIEKSLKASSLIKVNFVELNLINRILYDCLYDSEDIVLKIIEDFNIEMVCITLGENGATIITKNEKDTHRVELKKPIDTLGAGDAYSAILCLSFLKGLPIKEINILGNKFAAEICMVKGALPEDDSIYDRYREIFSRQ